MSNKKVLSKVDFLKKRDLRKRLVEVPEWGGSVWVQEMSAGAREEFDEWVVGNKQKAGIRLRLMVATTIDENGKLLFSDLDIADLEKQSAIIIHRVSDIGARLSGIGPAILDEMEKNSEPDLKDSLPLDFVAN